MPTPTDVVEALLFASDVPLEAERIREVLDLGDVREARELVDELARLVDVAQIEHLADTLGFQGRIGREQERFDDVSWSRHGWALHSVRRSGVR